ncbi:MAG: 30S ribosomal protein S20 [Candidatus Sumerlaeaceae bacterium]|nr:30S ribosomal protein S20 [Candidatus Sumerlaeaceae bacterium]
MPNIKSAKKRVKTNKRNEIANRAAKSTLKSAVKNANAAIAAKDATAAEQVKDTQGLAARLWKRGIIHKNKAARIQSRLMKKAAPSKA